MQKSVNEDVSEGEYASQSSLLMGKRDDEDGSMFQTLIRKITPEHEFTYYLNPKNSALMILTVAIILIGTANRLLFRLMLFPMKNYPYFLSNVTTAIYIPVFFPVVWYLQYFTNRITPAMTRFPKWKFIIMGGLDATSGLLMTFGGTNTSGPMQQLIIQGVIPFTMLFSWIVSLEILSFIFRHILQVRYRWGHYLGAAIIMGGILLALFPQLIHNNGGNTPTGLLIFFLSVIPMAFSGVYKEIAFKGEEDLDIYYVNAWVALFQLMWTVVYFPMTCIPGFGGVPFSDIARNFADGGKCLIGQNSILTGTDADSCHHAYLYVGGYIVANIFYNCTVDDVEVRICFVDVCSERCDIAIGEYIVYV